LELPVTTLTQDLVKKLKPRETAYYVTDSTIRGLQLRIAADGTRSWSVRYRIGHRQRRLTIGDASIVPLNDDTRTKPKTKGARTLAREALHQAANDVDPVDAKRQRREAVTVADLAAEYIKLHAKPKKRSWQNDQRILDTEILPEWKHRAAREITRRHVRDLRPRHPCEGTHGEKVRHQHPDT
jgi:hypothetical protein